MPTHAHAGFYDRVIVPWLTHVAMQNQEIRRRRAEIVPAARGRVLEIGIGSGLNLPYYRGVESVVGIDPSPRLLARAKKAATDTGVDVELVEGSAEDLPMPEESFDTVLTTCTLCTIPNAAKALAEMRRVLRPGGRLLFLEHGLSPDPRVRAWQDRLNPLWRRLAGGCNLNRPIDRLIAGAGFHIDALTNEYAKGPRPMTYLYRGAAKA